MFLVDRYREWQGRRRARQRLEDLMDDLARLSASRRRAAGAWRTPTLRAAIGIDPMKGDAQPIRRAAAVRTRGSS